MAVPPVQDGLLYENGKITVTRNIFTNNAGDRYIIASIKSLRDERKAKPVLVLIMGIAMMAIAGFKPLFPGSQIAFGVAGLVLAAGYFFMKDVLVIYVTNPKGETESFRTKDETLYRDVLRALKKAISSHAA